MFGLSSNEFFPNLINLKFDHFDLNHIRTRFCSPLTDTTQTFMKRDTKISNILKKIFEPQFVNGLC